MAFALVPAFRFLPPVTALTYMDDELQVVRLNKIFVPKLLLDLAIVNLKKGRNLFQFHGIFL